ncbi:MAG: hypothetical protein EOO23_00095 [Comamonadaceae bacterium]|nr:MAG: hypothetical protein EOO23_00095 [Comamonadaceae bacterium]
MWLKGVCGYHATTSQVFAHFMRRLLAVILLLSFFCQAFATARQVVAFDHEGGFHVEHSEMHLEGAAHHHDEDGVMHQDNSQESIQHMLAEASPGTAALFHFPQLSLPADRSPTPAVNAESVSPSPYLDGLRRPPRLIS